jgi:predicted GIY-YIG superfamily endonuclease
LTELPELSDLPRIFAAYILVIFSKRTEYYYSGKTTDLQRRMGEHRLKRGSKFMRRRFSRVYLGWWAECPNNIEAVRLEIKLKDLSHAQKKKLTHFEKSNWVRIR